jgi:hypothetical protein
MDIFVNYLEEESLIMVVRKEVHEVDRNLLFLVAFGITYCCHTPWHGIKDPVDQ